MGDASRPHRQKRNNMITKHPRLMSLAWSNLFTSLLLGATFLATQQTGFTTATNTIAITINQTDFKNLSGLTANILNPIHQIDYGSFDDSTWLPSLV